MGGDGGGGMHAHVFAAASADVVANLRDGADGHQTIGGRSRRFLRRVNRNSFKPCRKSKEMGEDVVERGGKRLAVQFGEAAQRVCDGVDKDLLASVRDVERGAPGRDRRPPPPPPLPTPDTPPPPSEAK